MTPLNHNPAQAMMVYDHTCAFCQAAVARWRQQTGTAIRYVALPEAKSRLSAEQCEACTQAIHLFMPNGQTYRGAHAVLMIWQLANLRRWPLWMYEHLPGAAPLAEAAYRFVAKRRLRLSRWFK